MILSGPKSYFDDYVRKKDTKRTLNDPPSLLTDRGAYVNFLEVQLERVSAACLGVQSYEQRFSDMQNLIVSLEQRCASTTRLVGLAQQCTEELRNRTEEKLDKICDETKAEHWETRKVMEAMSARIAAVEFAVAEIPVLQRRLDEADAKFREHESQFQMLKDLVLSSKQELSDRLDSSEKKHCDTDQAIQSLKTEDSRQQFNLEELNRTLRSSLSECESRVLQALNDNNDIQSRNLSAAMARSTEGIQKLELDVVSRESGCMAAVRLLGESLRDEAASLRERFNKKVDALEDKFVKDLDSEVTKVNNRITEHIAVIHNDIDTQKRLHTAFTESSRQQFTQLDRAIGSISNEQSELYRTTCELKRAVEISDSASSSALDVTMPDQTSQNVSIEKSNCFAAGPFTSSNAEDDQSERSGISRSTLPMSSRAEATVKEREKLQSHRSSSKLSSTQSTFQHAGGVMLSSAQPVMEAQHQNQVKKMSHSSEQQNDPQQPLRMGRQEYDIPPSASRTDTQQTAFAARNVIGDQVESVKSHTYPHTKELSSKAVVTGNLVQHKQQKTNREHDVCDKTERYIDYIGGGLYCDSDTRDDVSRRRALALGLKYIGTGLYVDPDIVKSGGSFEESNRQEHADDNEGSTEARKPSQKIQDDDATTDRTKRLSRLGSRSPSRPPPPPPASTIDQNGTPQCEKRRQLDGSSLRDSEISAAFEKFLKMYRPEQRNSISRGTTSNSIDLADSPSSESISWSDIHDLGEGVHSDSYDKGNVLSEYMLFKQQQHLVPWQPPSNMRKPQVTTPSRIRKSFSTNDATQSKSMPTTSSTENACDMAISLDDSSTIFTEHRISTRVVDKIAPEKRHYAEPAPRIQGASALVK
mmetsp:Transcript_12969/g.19538  ORF Transcript_12969/g.19538 Transcript_12969/m.19538 type:complete len:869 (-) Transcript_12969:126-2732(-)